MSYMRHIEEGTIRKLKLRLRIVNPVAAHTQKLNYGKGFMSTKACHKIEIAKTPKTRFLQSFEKFDIFL